MSNKLPTSIDTNPAEYELVSGSGSRFLKSDKSSTQKQGVAIDADRLNSAFTSDGYRLAANLKAGGEEPLDFLIVDMRDIIPQNGLKNFRGLEVSEEAPYILVGKSAQASTTGVDFELVGLRPGDTYEYGRSGTDTSGKERNNIFASNNFISRQQFAVNIDADGNINVYDQNSSNGTTVEWGTNEAPTDALDIDKTNPRSKLGGFSLKHEVAVEVSVAHESKPVFINAEQALARLHETQAPHDVNKVMASIAAAIIEQSDAPKERIIRDATEAITDLNSFDPAILNALDLERELARAKDSLRRQDVESLRFEYAAIVRKTGSWASKNSRWIEEKMTRDDRAMYDASLIEGMASKHFRRAVNGAQYVGSDRTPVMQYLRDRIA